MKFGAQQHTTEARWGGGEGAPHGGSQCAVESSGPGDMPKHPLTLIPTKIAKWRTLGWLNPNDWGMEFEKAVKEKLINVLAECNNPSASWPAASRCRWPAGCTAKAPLTWKSKQSLFSTARESLQRRRRLITVTLSDRGKQRPSTHVMVWGAKNTDCAYIILFLFDVSRKYEEGKTEACWVWPPIYTNFIVFKRTALYKSTRSLK